MEGSDPRYSFHWIGKSDRLYVFEAPVDLLSFLTLRPKDWMYHSYVTLDGVSEHAMLRQLELHPNLQKVILCLDHDEAGIETNGRLRDILVERGYMDTGVLQSVWKDWNEDVKALHGIPPIPASEHPKLVLLPKVCEKIFSLCEVLSTQRDLRAFLADCARELELLTASGKVTPENTGTAVDSLECMAADSLLLLKDLCRQMERLCRTYHVRRDRLFISSGPLLHPERHQVQDRGRRPAWYGALGNQTGD